MEEMHESRTAGQVQADSNRGVINMEGEDSD